MAAEELGQIQRPQAGNVGEKRKLYFVPLVYPIPGAPDGFSGRLSKYWEAVDDHVERMEAKAGIVKRIFHEGIAYGGQTGLDQLKQVNTPAFPFVNGRVQSGADFEALEHDDTFLEAMDWGRCLQIGFASRKVAETVQEAFQKASEARLEHMAQQLDDRLGEGEAGVLIMSDSRAIRTPNDAEVFHIVPRELDELNRWLQQELQAQQKAAQGAATGQGEPAQGAETAGEPGSEEESSGGSGLWVPGSNR